MGFETILYETRGAVGLVTLNRPTRLNAINFTLLRELMDVLDQCEKDRGVGAVVVTGGPNFFSAGADVKELAGFETLSDFLAQGRKLHHTIETLGKPVVAAMSGPVLGGGFELALSCDLRVASEKATMALSEIKLGALPMGGGTQRLPRLIGPALAKQLLFTGNPIDATEAYRVGLVNLVASVDVFLERAVELAAEIAERAPLAVRWAKSCVNTGVQLDLESALNYEALCGTYLAGSEDQKEGFLAFAEKRKPVFKGR